MSLGLQDLASARLALGAAAVLALGDAARLLPMSDGEARAWLHDQGLVRDLAGRDVVVWGDVIDALRKVKVPVRRQGRGVRLADF